MFAKKGRYKKNWKIKWKKTENLLERAIAIPIMVNDSKKTIINRGKNINSIISKIL